MDKLHLINTRDTVIFDIFGEDFKDIAFEELHRYSNDLEYGLKKCGVNYSTLKKCLIPGNNGDVAFIFNWQMIDSSCYGEYVLDLLMPFLQDNNFCYLHGDYGFASDEEHVKVNKFTALNNALYEKLNHFIDPSLCYVVYITNIGLKKAIKINCFLKENEPSYIGFADLNTNNLFKTFLSIIVGQSFIKVGTNVIQGSPDSTRCEVSEDYNLCNLDKYVNKLINVPDGLYNIFLLYRIPSILEPQDKDRDLYYAFKYLSENVKYNFINNFKIIIDDRKISYIFEKKSYIPDKWQINSQQKMKELLIFKIEQSLLLGEIFNLEIDKEHKVLKFDICIEHLKIKYEIGLKLLYEEKEIHFITISSIKIKE